MAVFPCAVQCVILIACLFYTQEFIPLNSLPPFYSSLFPLPIGKWSVIYTVNLLLFCYIQSFIFYFFIFIF